MSQENVEIIRRVSAEFTKSLQVPSELVAADVIWDMSSWPSWAGQQEFHGLDAFLAFFADWTRAYQEWDQKVEDIIDAGGSQVVEITSQRGRLRGSDSWIEWRYGIVYTVEKGLIRRGELYGTPDDALAAAGLSE
jgi:ketosteroid isomerase-like protein